MNLTLYISNPADSSAISAYLSVSGTNSWAHAVLTSSGATLALEDGREFTVAHVDRDHDGLVESGDNITVAGSFDSGDYIIALYFEPSYATICSVTAHVD